MKLVTFHLCLKSKQMCNFWVFLSCGADVNKANKTPLHYLLDTKLSRKRKLIKSVNTGFDFIGITS